MKPSNQQEESESDDEGMKDIDQDMGSLKIVKTVKTVKIIKTKIVTHDDETEWE